VGASGAISGLLGALLVLAPRADIRVGLPFTTAGRAWNLPAPALVGFWAGLQIGLLLFTSGSGLPVHLGGFAYGLAFGWLLSLVPARQPASVS
jgi:membrane associated rhomboid family serine protease